MSPKKPAKPMKPRKFADGGSTEDDEKKKVEAERAKGLADKAARDKVASKTGGMLGNAMRSIVGRPAKIDAEVEKYANGGSVRKKAGGKKC